VTCVKELKKSKKPQIDTWRWL